MKPKYHVDFQEEGHIYTYNGVRVPCVSDILAHFGLVDFSNVPENVLEASRNFGDVVHEVCRLFDLDDLAEFDPQIEPYLNGWIKYRQDEPGDFELIEVPLYSKVWNVCGTPDRQLGAKVVDLKTGQPRIAHQIQTSLYKILIEENFDVRIRAREIIHLEPDNYKKVIHEERTDLSVAKSMLQVFGWKQLRGLC